MTSSGITVKRVVGKRGIIHCAIDLGTGSYLVAVGAAFDVPVAAREDAAFGGLVVTFLGVVVEEGCFCVQREVD